MNEEQKLKEKIWNHPFVWEGQSVDIVKRLMMEQNWSHKQALEGIEEYRRFCYLAVTKDHVVTPSVNVDIIWHTHLLYTQDYWKIFCREVLGKELHHGPSKGKEENQKFYDFYALTLRSYQEEFGDINEDWWPSAKERFRPILMQKLVNTNDFWIIKKPEFLNKILNWRKK